MEDLVEALQIMIKYGFVSKYPTTCVHDEFHVCVDFDLDIVSEEDIKKLDELGFLWDDEFEHFISYRFGSC